MCIREFSRRTYITKGLNLRCPHYIANLQCRLHALHGGSEPWRGRKLALPISYAFHLRFFPLPRSTYIEKYRSSWKPKSIHIKTWAELNKKSRKLRDGGSGDRAIRERGGSRKGKHLSYIVRWQWMNSRLKEILNFFQNCNNTKSISYQAENAAWQFYNGQAMTYLLDFCVIVITRKN